MLQAGKEKAIKLTKIKVTFSGLSEQPLPHKTPASFAQFTGQQEPGTPPASLPRSRLSVISAPSPLRPCQPIAHPIATLASPAKKLPAAAGPSSTIMLADQKTGLQAHPCTKREHVYAISDVGVSPGHDSGAQVDDRIHFKSALPRQDPSADALARVPEKPMQRSRSQPTLPHMGRAAGLRSPAFSLNTDAPFPQHPQPLVNPHAAADPLSEENIQCPMNILGSHGTSPASDMWRDDGDSFGTQGLQDHVRAVALAAADEAEVAASQAAEQCSLLPLRSMQLPQQLPPANDALQQAGQTTPGKASRSTLHFHTCGLHVKGRRLC